MQFSGCYSEAVNHLEHSLHVTECIYGADSVELARELHKMAEVQIHAACPHLALVTASRALEIAKHLFSSADDWLQELLCLTVALSEILADSKIE